MPVFFNSNKLIPAPFVSINKQFERGDDGAILGKTYRFVVSGTLVAHMGSPDSSGAFWQLSDYPPDESLTHDQHLKSILRKQKALKQLFSANNDGKTFEIVPLDGTAPTKANVRIVDINFPDGQWFNTCPYTITLEADRLYLNGVEDDGEVDSYYISKSSEDWDIEILDENQGTYRLTHSVSATGKREIDETGALVAQAWESARTYVLNKIGLGLKPQRMVAPDVLDETGLQAFNYIRSQNIGELSGTFAATETWVCYNPADGIAALEEYTITHRQSSDDNKVNISIDGSITGLEVRNNQTRELTSTKHANATAKWNSVKNSIFSRCSTFADTTLNPTPLQFSHAENDLAGTFNYTYEYNDRPLSVIPGALNELITISDDNAADVFAVIPVLGRAAGPVIQGIGTITEKKRSVDIEISMPPNTISAVSSPPVTNTLVLSYAPTGTTKLFLESDKETWVVQTGKYTRSTVYVWQ